LAGKDLLRGERIEVEVESTEIGSLNPGMQHAIVIRGIGLWGIGGRAAGRRRQIFAEAEKQ